MTRPKLSDTRPSADIAIAVAAVLAGCVALALSALLGRVW